MTPIEHIRKSVFKVSQAELASFAGTTQASVSRWEGGTQEPSREEMANIRAEAAQRGLDWDDRWFFEVPPGVECAST
jgi:transcriptional regulator with XRE-family HTH domain